MGPVHCQIARASGNGATSDFTGSDADKVDNYLLVDDTAADGDSTYVESAVDDEIDLYDCSLALTTEETILALEVFTDCRKTDSGNRKMRTILRAGAVNNFGTEHAVPVVYKRYGEIYLTNPDTAVAFTESDVIEVGQQVRAG